MGKKETKMAPKKGKKNDESLILEQKMVGGGLIVVKKKEEKTVSGVMKESTASKRSCPQGIFGK